MSSAPAISVVVPTYNRKALVLEALKSVFAQTLEDFELLVVDDGSTDGTQQVVEAEFQNEPRLRYIVKKNGGTGSARNLGVKNARGTLLAFLDSDDLWHPRYLESQKEVLESENADLVLCDVDYLNHPDRKSDHMFGDPDFREPTSPEAMCRGGWGLPSAEMLRTEVARRLPFRRDYHYSEDTEFLFRFHKLGYRCVLNHDRLAVWRNHDGGEGAAQKTDKSSEFERERLVMLEEYRSMVPNSPEMEKRLYQLHRTMAKSLVADKKYRLARPHIKVWWRHRPTRARLALLYLRTYLPGGRA